MRHYIVTVTWPDPIVRVERLTIEAAGPDFARAIAYRQIGVKGCTASVREDDRSSYVQDYVDSQMGALA